MLGGANVPLPLRQIPQLPERDCISGFEHYHSLIFSMLLENTSESDSAQIFTDPFLSFKYIFSSRFQGFFISTWYNIIMMKL